MRLSTEQILPFLVRIRQEFAGQPKLAMVRTGSSSAYISLQYLREHGIGGASARLVYPGGARKHSLYTVADFLATVEYEANERGYGVVNLLPDSP